ncbi:hypothetical protein HHK36_029167 [Tetracentron sinense]|uniref:F-box domain-containing protein n=1 Tax=Tetracentron sinense TaxID=13715 RepID=A0A835D3B3_TETSI|nr:hypothetical protein HHK36_029167 [Tetracentron sinense]
MDFSSVSFYIAAAATAFCCLFALWAVRSSPAATSIFRKERSKRLEVSSKKKGCGCSCSCGGGASSVLTTTPYVNGSAGDMYERAPVVSDLQMGASMMERLVPEITTHALSYLDYPSLCRLSMTNSSMRKAANDDNAWKALYHKDFALEQESVTPLNGWKAYYAATRAIVNVNAEFYNIIRERSLPAMGHLWLKADYVKCVHGSGDFFTGYGALTNVALVLLLQICFFFSFSGKFVWYNAVMESWQFAFSWGQGVAFQIRDVRARVLTDMAWVTMKTFIDMETGPFHVTNVYEFHNGQWYMVHHHSSLMLIDGEVEQHNMLG